MATSHDDKAMRENRSNETNKISLIGLTRSDLQETFEKNLPHTLVRGFHANILYKWIYKKGVQQFENITDLSKEMRKALDDRFQIYPYPCTIVNSTNSKDEENWDEHSSTTKLLMACSDSKKSQFESVFIPEKTRGTLCVSSQCGCSLSCKFCATGTQALQKNLTSGEIVGQVTSSVFDQHMPVSNIVYMGMGEPFLNYKNVSKSLDVLTDVHGMCFPKRKIIVSTSGIVPVLHKFATEHKGVKIAISLHATTNELRDWLVPINKTYPLEMLLESCRTLPNLSKSNALTFEYIMLRNINDSIQDAKRLVNLLVHYKLLLTDGFLATVNLIPFNKWDGSPFECSEEERIIEFSSYCYSKGLRAPIRWPRGRDISGACGMLRLTTNQDRDQFNLPRSENTKKYYQPPTFAEIQRFSNL